jgi:hypothetical protein
MQPPVREIEQGAGFQGGSDAKIEARDSFRG